MANRKQQLLKLIIAKISNMRTQELKKVRNYVLTLEEQKEEKL